jgi:hypothetical protein
MAKHYNCDVTSVSVLARKKEVLQDMRADVRKERPFFYDILRKCASNT